MHRVLKAGGIIGVRNVDQGTNIYSPTDPLLDQAHALYFERWKHIGGDPFGARHSRALLREAGFVNTKASATTECWSTKDGTQAWGELFASIVEAPAFSDHVIALAKLPADATLEDAIERLVFLGKTERGLAELDAGQGVDHAEVKRRLLR